MKKTKTIVSVMVITLLVFFASSLTYAFNFKFDAMCLPQEPIPENLTKKQVIAKVLDILLESKKSANFIVYYTDVWTHRSMPLQKIGTKITIHASKHVFEIKEFNEKKGTRYVLNLMNEGGKIISNFQVSNSDFFATVKMIFNRYCKIANEQKSEKENKIFLEAIKDFKK